MHHDSDETRVFTTAGPDASALVGTTLAGRYRIEKLLGIGAMGAVYLGQHLKIGRRDAIKVLHAAQARDPDAIARFDRGARNVGAIRHPNVCTIYDFSDTDDGLQYLAMEFVAGEALKDLLDREGPLPLERSLRIAEQIASALEAAHAAGVVHRDLKPANVMIARNADGTDAVKVVDFDISKGAHEGVEAEVTRVGFVVGTPEYMSPEQLWGGALDGRSDVYSLALVLYRMLTGGLPFRGETMQETMSARLTDAPLLRLEEIALGAAFPPALQQALDRALMAKPDQRTASAAAFAAELRAIREPAPDAVAPIPGTRVVAAPSGKRAATAKRVALAAGIAAVALIGVAAQDSIFARGADEQQESSTAELPADNGAATDAGDAETAADDPIPTNDAARDRMSGGDDAGATPPVESRTAASEPAAPVESAASDANLDATRAAALLDAQRARLAVSPVPDAATLRAMRDTAQTIFELPAAGESNRALAAFLAANMSFYLGDGTTCTTWARRAAERAPSSASYARFIDTCALAGQ